MAFGLQKKGKTEPENLDYTIRVNSRQLKLIQDALEEYFRLRMGQVFDLSDALAFQHYEYKQNDPEFDERILRRDDGELLLKQAMDAFSAKNIMHWCKTPDVQVAIDMWHVIRHYFWTQLPEDSRRDDVTDAGPVYIFGDEPMIEVEKPQSNPTLQKRL